MNLLLKRLKKQYEVDENFTESMYGENKTKSTE
jgi:hypothetical protein